MDILAQVIMGLTLVLMLIGKTPLYTTAIVGSTIAALVYGIPLTGDAEITIKSLVTSGLNPVIADMVGVLIFIGAMEHVGYLDVLVKAMIRIGNKIGGGPGVATAGGIGAGIIGAFTGFTQPAITAVVTGPASTKLGVDPSESAGAHAHAGHLGNFAGFTHPTLLAVLATVGLQFGWINTIGLVTSLAIFAVSFVRMRRHMERSGTVVSDVEREAAMREFVKKEDDVPLALVSIPFLLLVVGFALGYPVFIVGFLVSLIILIMGRTNPNVGEKSMLKSVERIAVPLIATIGFLYMSGVISAVGVTGLLSGWFEPFFSTAPILTMALISAAAGLLTQSNSASAAIIVPMVTLVMAQGGVNPLALAAAACGPTAVMQYFLTGGPVASLATAIPMVPGSDLKKANRFQRPSQLVGLLVVVVIAVLIGGF